MVEEGVKAKVVAVERGDYVGREKGVVHDSKRRAIMAIETWREDGKDCAVLPPVAVGSFARDTDTSRRLFVPRRRP